MIVFPHLRKLIITPPKCGSTSLNEFLCRPPYNGYVLIGPMGNISYDNNCLNVEAYDHHTNMIPNGLDNYEKYAIVRHPLDRLISLWAMHIKYAFMIGGSTMDANQFLLDITMNKHKAYFIQWNQEKCLRGVKIDKYLRLEDIDNALHKVGIINKYNDTMVPKLNITNLGNKPRWQDVLRGCVLEAARDWWEPDLKFGYEYIDTNEYN